MSKLLEQINKTKTTKRLGDLVLINQSSITSNFSHKEIEYIDTASVTRNHFDRPKILNINEAPNRAKRLLKDGDTIISTVRPSLCHYGFIKNAKPNTVASTGFVVLTPNNVNPFYLYSYLTQDSITDTLSSIAEATTTTFPAFRPEVLSEMEIEIPDLPTQKKIAEILSAYDSKIENNNKIIKNLEATAQAIFNEWFVEFEFPSSGGVPVGRGGVIPRATQNYHSLPYNPKLKDRAKELRKAGNLAEVLLWLQIKNKQFFGLDFDRQKIIGNYIVDFYCANIGLVVEIDGSSHNDKYEYDKERDDYLESLDLKVVHFTDTDVKKNIDAVLTKIKEEIQKPPRPMGTPPMEGNKYKSSGGKMVESEMGEIPEGWEILKLGNIFNIKYGKNLPTSKISSHGKFPVYGAGGVIGFYEEKNVDGKVILITCRGNGSGTIWRTNGEGFVTNNSFLVLPKNNFNYINFVSIYFLLKNSNIYSALSGSAQPQITIDGLSPLETILPSKKTLIDFENLTTTMFDLVDRLLGENISLRSQRDQLLAKLI